MVRSHHGGSRPCPIAQVVGHRPTDRARQGQCPEGGGDADRRLSPTGTLPPAPPSRSRLGPLTKENQHMLLRKRFLSLAAVASLAVAGVACSDDGGTDTGTDTTDTGD